MLTQNKSSLFFNKNFSQEKEVESIKNFFQHLKKFLGGEIGENAVISQIPSFTKEKLVLDSHQSQHLGGRSDKSSFRFRNRDIVNALAQCINKIISNHYRKNKKKNKIDEYIKDPFEDYRKFTTFCIDMGFIICDKDIETRKSATGIVLTPFGDKYYHIYPADLGNPKYKNTQKYVLIDANDILDNFSTNSKSYSFKK